MVINIVMLHLYYHLSYINVFIQDCNNSIANALELLQSCTKPLMWTVTTLIIIAISIEVNHEFSSSWSILLNLFLDAPLW